MTNCEEGGPKWDCFWIKINRLHGSPEARINQSKHHRHGLRSKHHTFKQAIYDNIETGKETGIIVLDFSKADIQTEWVECLPPGIMVDQVILKGPVPNTSCG